MNRKRLPFAYSLFEVACLCICSSSPAADISPDCQKIVAASMGEDGTLFVATPPIQEALDTIAFIQRNAVNPADANALLANESVNRHFLDAYIEARESYPRSSITAYAYYSMVHVYSDIPVFDEYQKQITLSNPQSPGARLGGSGTRTVEVGDVTYAAATHDLYGHAARNYKISIHADEHASLSRAESKVLSLTIEYIPLELNSADRCLNPSGFHVINYDAAAAAQ